MNWKTRQMFSDREHGIVSGLSPISMTGGGNVPYPSYENGGDVLPQLSPDGHTHPELHSHGSQRPPGSPLRPEDIVLFGQEGMQGGGPVPYPSYQFGTGPGEAMAIDLFQQGDEDINEPLNMMAQAISPSLSDIGPTETVEETVTMDQGPITETVEEISIEEGPGEYEVELQELKEGVRNEIRSYVSQGGSGEIEEYLGQMNVVYSNQLDELKRKYGVTEYSPEEELITPDFMSELESLASVPGFVPGGIDIYDETVVAGMDDATLQIALDSYFEGKQPVNAKLWRQTPSEGRKVLAIRILGGGGPQTGTGLAEALAKLKQERMDLVPEMGRAAGAAYKTKEGGWGGFMGKLQAQRAGETLAQDKILTEQTELLTRLSGGAGVPKSIMDSLTADQSNIITGASDKNYQTEILKNKMKAWSNMMKAAGEARTPKLGLTQIKNYITVYGTPPDGILNATTSDWEGARMSARDGSLVTWEEYLAILEADEDIKSFADYVNKLAKWLTLDKV